MNRETIDYLFIILSKKWILIFMFQINQSHWAREGFRLSKFVWISEEIKSARIWRWGDLQGMRLTAEEHQILTSLESTLSRIAWWSYTISKN